MYDAPPDELSDLELSRSVQAGDRNAAETLLARHEGMVRSVVRNSRYPVTVDRDDLMQVGRMALLAAANARNFDVARSKFTTYAMTSIRRAVWKEIGRQVGQLSAFGGGDGDRTALDFAPDREEIAGLDQDYYRSLGPLERSVVRFAVESDGLVPAATIARYFGLIKEDVAEILHRARQLLGTSHVNAAA